METTSLPMELIEGILLHVPLHTPLSHCWGKSPNASAVHDHCAAALVVVAPSPELLLTSLPRMHNGLAKLILSPMGNNPRFLKLVDSATYAVLDDMFEAAFVANQVPVLDWWLHTAKLELPELCGPYDDALYLHNRAIKAEAWDALHWLATSGSERCEYIMTAGDLAEMLLNGNDCVARFVELWMRTGYELNAGCGNDHLLAACETGRVGVLDAWNEYEGQWCDGPQQDEASWYAIRGRGPVIPMLEWMLAHGWGMPNVAEVASECGKVEVLEWWKANKTAIDQAVRNAFQDDQVDDEDAGESDAEDDQDRQDAATMDVEPEWLSSLKEDFCLDLARNNGHEHVIDWWKHNMDLLPLPDAECLVVDASSRGDLDVLKAWHQRKQHSHRPYDCTQVLRVATENGHLAVLAWWIHESGLRVTYDSVQVIHAALSSAHWRLVVEWWRNKSGAVFDDCSNLITECYTITILDRWNQMDRFLPFDSAKALEYATRYNLVDVIEWWKVHGC